MAGHYGALKEWGCGTIGGFFGVPGRGKGALEGSPLVTWIKRSKLSTSGLRVKQATPECSCT